MLESYVLAEELAGHNLFHCVQSAVVLYVLVDYGVGLPALSHVREPTS